ncbi:hypothetical protein DV738_g5147, partial [Chaetothyriales sp. CBS 135597]
MMPPSHLLPDGTDDLHCPSPRGEFMFRVWAGGDVSFARPKLTGTGAVSPVSGNGNDNGGGPSTLYLGEQVVDAKMVDGGEKVFVKWLVTPDAALLFRFSALTLNAHAIHLDRQYTRQAYGLPDLVVHGPLTT